MKHFLNNAVVCLHMGVHISISVFGCTFEEAALESDVHSHYYTAGYWHDITLSCSSGLQNCAHYGVSVSIQAWFFSPLLGSWSSSSAADEESAEQISLKRKDRLTKGAEIKL